VIRWQVSDGHRTVSRRGVAATREQAWTDAATCAAMIAADPLAAGVLFLVVGEQTARLYPAEGHQHERATTERVAADLADAMRGLLIPPQAGTTPASGGCAVGGRVVR
jgi:hypothetical protein